MSDTSEELERQIRELEADRASVRSERARAAIDEELAAVSARRAALLDLRGAQLGDVKVGDVAGGDVRKGAEGSVALNDDARLDGVAVGVNYGVVQIFFGAAVPPDGEQQVRA